MDFLDLVRRRRMVRNFSTEPLPPGAIEDLLNVARRAPSAGFTQGQSFVVATRPDLREAIGRTCQEQVYVDAGYHAFLSKAPALLIACTSEPAYRERYAEPDVVSADAPDEVDSWPMPYWHMDLGCAVMLVLLAAVNQGLACGVAAIYDVPRLRALLGIPSDVVPGLVIAVGHAAEDVRWPGVDRERTWDPGYIHHEHW
jgi:nitroreductase